MAYATAPSASFPRVAFAGGPIAKAEKQHDSIRPRRERPDLAHQVRRQAGSVGIGGHAAHGPYAFGNGIEFRWSRLGCRRPDVPDCCGVFDLPACEGILEFLEAILRHRPQARPRHQQQSIAGIVRDEGGLPKLEGGGGRGFAVFPVVRRGGGANHPFTALGRGL
jgi:hypothetical protein